MSLITGKISWFGGPQDKTTGPTTASGAPTSTPGIAVYNQSTLGGYWLLRMPNGHGVVVKQTDIGPAPSTGRTFDFTYSLLPLLGYNTSNFPTNQSVRGVYLGKTIQDVANNFANAIGQANISTDVVNQPGNTSFFSQLQSKGVQAVNFDLLTPAGGGQSYQQSVQQAADTAQAVATWEEQLAKVLGNLLNPRFWLRGLEVLAGIALLVMGLMSLSGRTTTPVTVAKGAARNAGKAAALA